MLVTLRVNALITPLIVIVLNNFTKDQGFDQQKYHNENIKIRILKASVWSVLLYGCKHKKTRDQSRSYECSEGGGVTQ